MTLHFTIWTERGGTARDFAACNGHEASSRRGCAARDLARLLVAAGEPDGPIEARSRPEEGGKLRYTVKSMHAFARTALEENPRLATRRWRPFPARGNADHGSADAGAVGETGQEAEGALR